AYNALLTALDQLPRALSPRLYPAIRQLLARGLPLADVIWASEHHLLTPLCESKLPPARVRRVADQFAAHGLTLGAGDLFQVAQALTTPAQKSLVERWLAWADRWPAQALPPRLQQVVKCAFSELVLPALRRSWELACVEQWLTAE